MWTEIYQFVKINPEWATIISVIVALTVWLYKEFKEMIDKDHKTKMSENERKKSCLVTHTVP